MFDFWLRKGRDLYQAVLYGIGHGGVEAFLVAGIALLVLVQVWVLGVKVEWICCQGRSNLWYGSR